MSYYKMQFIKKKSRQRGLMVYAKQVSTGEDKVLTTNHLQGDF